MLSVFLRRRHRRLVAYTLIFGLGTLMLAMRQSEFALWTPLISGFEYALSPEGGDASFEALKFFAIASLVPYLIALSVMALVSFTFAFIVVTIIVTAVPLRFQAYLDGVAAMAGLIAIFEGLGLAAPLRNTFGSIGTVAFYWAIMFSTSAFVWNHLPFGFRYRGAASCEVPLPLNTIADRLIPGRAPDQDLADISMFNRPPEGGETDVFLRSEPDQPDGHFTFELFHDDEGSHVATRTIRYELVTIAPEITALQITVTLTGLSPLSLWDFWNRPFTQDYADHLVARLTKTKDGSTYGRMQSAMRQKQEKRRLSEATA